MQSFKAQATKAESTAEKVGVETARAKLLEEVNSIWMFKMCATPSDKQVVQIRICQRLGTNFVGIDTDAAMSISGYKSDFAWICHNTARCLSFEFQGISGDEGAMTPTGEGPGIQHVKAFKNRQDAELGQNSTRFRLIDNDTFLIKKLNARIVCACKLAEQGLPLVMNYLGRGNHALVCEVTHQVIPCMRVEGILVCEMQNVHAGRIQLDPATVRACTLESRDANNPMMREGKQRLYVQVSKVQSVPMQIEPGQTQVQSAWKEEERESQGKRRAHVLNVGAAPDYERLYEGKLEPRPRSPLTGEKKKKKGTVSGADAITSGRFGDMRPRQAGNFTGYAKLTQSQKNWLWHHRFGCRNLQDLRRMQTSGCYGGIEVNGELDDDCFRCNHGGQKLMSFPPVPKLLRPTVPPYHTLDCDGVSGFKVKTIGKCVGAFCYFARGVSRRFVQLYKTKDQMARLTEDLIVLIEEGGHRVFKLVFDNAGENISDEMLAMAKAYDILLSPVAPREPKEDHYAESTVGLLCNMARHMHAIAPHMPRSMWGLALRYAAEVDAVIGKEGNDGKSAIEITTGRVPNSGSHPRPVWGCDCCILVKKLEKTEGKMQSNCEEGYFAGLENFLFLIKVKDSNEIYKVSKRRVKTMEREFCGSLGPAQKAITLDLDTVEPHALPSVLSAREKEERNQWFAAPNEMLETRNWRDCYMDFVNKNFVNDSDAAEDDDPASDENDMKFEVGMERDEPLAGPVLRSSGEPNLPKNDGWNGDKEDEVEEQEEQDEESVEQEELLSDNSDGEAEEEATSVYTTVTDTESVKSVAKKFGCSPAEIVRLNKPDGDVRLYQTSKFKIGTGVNIPSGISKIQATLVWKLVNRKSEFVRQEEAQKRNSDRMPELDDIPWEDLTAKQRRALADIPCGNFFEAMLFPDWHQKLESARKEHQAFVDKKVFEEIDYANRDRSATILEFVEIYTTKFHSDGGYNKHKLRLAIGGHRSIHGKDFDKTYTPQLGSEEIRLFGALGAQLGEEPWSADVATAYLNSLIKVLIYAYKPSFVKFLDLSMEQLLKLRAILKKLTRKELKALKIADRKQPGSVWKILRCVYGLMDSGLHWSDDFAEFVKGPKVQCKALTIAPCMFWREVPWDNKRLTLIKFTDDMSWNGSLKTKKWFAELLSKQWKVTIEQKWTDFVGMSISCRPDLGYVEMTQPGFIERMASKFEEWLPTNFREKAPKIPMKAGEQLDDLVSDDEWELAKHLPYPSLVCAMNYAVTMTRLECSCSQSMLGGKLSRWSRRDFIAAVYQLWYLHGTKDRGVVYTQNQDPHGPNVVWLSGDSDLGSHSSRRVRTCSVVGINGAAVLLKSKKRGLHDATMRAELEASFYTGMHGLGFINVLNELEFWQLGNVLYTDNFANYKFCDGRMSLASKSKHAEIRQLLVLDWIKNNRLSMKWQPTAEMCADIGTKNLAVAQFTKLRDFVTGYHFAKVIFEQRVSGDAQISKTFWSGLYKRVTDANPPDGSTSKHPLSGSASKHQKKRR